MTLCSTKICMCSNIVIWLGNFKLSTAAIYLYFPCSQSCWWKIIYSIYFMELPRWFSGKILPAMQEMQNAWVQSLGQEDPLEEEMATHSIILAWRIPRTEEPGRLQCIGSQRVRHSWVLTHMHLFYILK